MEFGLKGSIFIRDASASFVSILVVMEFGLKVVIDNLLTEVPLSVSILVVMEFGLKASTANSNTSKPASFNPCCNGIRS